MAYFTIKQMVCVEDLDLDNSMFARSKPKKKKSKLIKDFYKQTPGWVLWIDKTHLIPIIKIRYNRKHGGTR